MSAFEITSTYYILQINTIIKGFLSSYDTDEKLHGGVRENEGKCMLQVANFAHVLPTYS